MFPGLLFISYQTVKETKFAFSVGDRSLTINSLAGMIHKVGLLPADNHQQVPFAYKMYTRTDYIGWEQSNAFKLAFASTVQIEFLGVWDTVDSVGFIPKRLPFTTSNTIVKTVRHAISLDERRAKFKPNFWNRHTAEEQSFGVHTVRLPTPESDHDEKDNSHGNHRDARSHSKEPHADQKLEHYENLYSIKENDRETDIQEVWFAGCHCGSVANKTRHSLARISLRWMVRECFKADTGIMFKPEALRTIGLDPATLYPFVVPRPPPRLDALAERIEKVTQDGLFKRLAARWKRKDKAIPSVTIVANDHSVIDEELEDLKDALSPIYDQLQLKRSWWILELLPLHLRYQKDNNKWVTTFRSNMATPRLIPRQHDNGVNVHRTVKLRMRAQPATGHKNRYTPKAHLTVEPTWVD
ncbi:hypothetical protein C0995_011182 [Termitomyces sp. Mi166|nr:hypothetical protein C0995_011182 [Termitomyces sp. Mi166\